MKPEPLYKVIAATLIARDSCMRSGNDEWRARHEARIRELVKRHLPSGSGFDNGTTFDDLKSNGERLVFSVGYHHMNDSGAYDGWTTHTVVVRPSLAFGFCVTVGGRNRNDIKGFIGETFSESLRTPIEEFEVT